MVIVNVWLLVLKNNDSTVIIGHSKWEAGEIHRLFLSLHLPFCTLRKKAGLMQ